VAAGDELVTAGDELVTAGDELVTAGDELSPLELALGLPIGAGAPAALPAGGDPLRALEAAVREPLRGGRCLVSFSGGRDSSAVLAVATRVARAEGLPDPVPATIRAPDAPLAEESRWQELVVAHLGLADWLRLEFSDELDLVGPVAAAAMRRHGLLWPFNAHFHVPLLEAARGGTVLTGIGGDELFRSVASTLPSRRARSIALYAAPRPVRRRWHGRPAVAVHPWLTAAGERAGRAALAAWDAAEPRRLQARMRHVRAARYLTVGTAGLERLASDAGAAIAHPLLDRAVWGAVEQAAPRLGHRDRQAAMQATFGGLLPAELLARADKAGFDEVFFNAHSRAFAAQWSGTGVPEDVVEARALREHWRAGEPRAQSFSLLQAAWLADRGQQPVGGDVERRPAARAAEPQHRK
jgi:asparagine synthase (glutamine-hydrolysing)